MPTKDGGYAFPGFNPAVTGGDLIASGGMSLRDYFAAKAMQAGIGLIPNMQKPATGATGPETISAMAYEYADAMLEARAQK